jgi:deoxyadenosine/deoxycytidine kinase
MLNERYEIWIDKYTSSKLLIVNVDDLNFHTNADDLSKIIDRIDAEIHGLF